MYFHKNESLSNIIFFMESFDNILKAFLYRLNLIKKLQENKEENEK